MKEPIHISDDALDAIMELLGQHLAERAEEQQRVVREELDDAAFAMRVDWRVRQLLVDVFPNGYMVEVENG